ncbi:MAG: hypothetical protein AB8B55_20275 [Mariniblastus sp.]
MNIHRALSDIADIRAQLDRTEAYQGFRSTAVGISVLVLVAGAWVEKVWISQPQLEVQKYLIVWLSVAAVSSVIAISEMLIRGRVSRNRLVWQMHWALVRRVAPSFIFGFVLTMVIAINAIKHNLALENSALEHTSATSTTGLMMMLPGLWAMIYGQALFSCQQHLPRQVSQVALYFFVGGIAMIGYGLLTFQLAGWQMVALFGVGQAWLAYVLYLSLERGDGEKE